MLSIIYWLWILAACLVMTLLSAVAWVLLYPFDKRRTVVHALSRGLVWLIHGVPFLTRHRVEGLEKIDPNRPYVIMSNHNSMFDITSMYYLPLNFRWVTKREVIKTPFFGQLIFMHGDIMINRGRAAQAMEQLRTEGKMWLDRGVSVAIFPEGTRSKTGEMGRFKPGGFMMAKELGATILPVVLDGTHTVVKRKSFLFNWRNRVTVRVLDPIEAEEVAAMDLRALLETTESRIREELTAIRAGR
ncbi:MAG: 1-acyl-sn-glycerol-3-phosphate acyltransferase [Alistipes sp.]|nr:1-acyl-sn-glycerol-3-phosphate acyltransferase [Alistipes sp.]